MKYVQTSPLVLGGNPFLHSLNRNCQETCSLAEPDGGHGVRGAFATHKEMFVNMPVGMRLPLYCTAAGRAVLSRLDRTWPTGCWSAATVDPIPPPRSPAWTPCWLSWSSRAGTAMHVQWRVLPGDITVSAAVLDAGGIPGRGQCPVPSSRWSFEQAQAVFGPQVVETAHAISVSRTLGRSYPFYELEPPGGALRATPISVAGEA